MQQDVLKKSSDNNNNGYLFIAGALRNRISKNYLTKFVKK